MKSIDVRPRAYCPTYSVHVGAGLLDSFECPYKKVAIIADTTTAELFGKRLQSRIGGELFALPAGEGSKCRATKEWLEDQLIAKGFGRDCSIVALGGGVVSDVAGFVASTYCRGVALILLPTTLLAMCDAAIGGKTGVNVAHGKNMIGTIYHPQAVYCDTKTLTTLPAGELKNGIVEAIKHGLIIDEEYFSFLENHVEEITQLDPDSIQELICQSIRIKQMVIENDTYDIGLRRILNFGHTVGHAIEALSGYSISHGRAVATGIIIESMLSKLSEKDFARIQNLFKAYEIDTELTLPLTYDSMKHDKKAQNGMPTFVLLEGIGKAYCKQVSEKEFTSLSLSLELAL